VREEEQARGWTPGPALRKPAEGVEGCDFFSHPPGGGLPHPIEVKGWGESLFRADARSRTTQTSTPSSMSVPAAIRIGALRSSPT